MVFLLLGNIFSLGFLITIQFKHKYSKETMNSVENRLAVMYSGVR